MRLLADLVDVEVLLLLGAGSRAEAAPEEQAPAQAGPYSWNKNPNRIFHMLNLLATRP